MLPSWQDKQYGSMVRTALWLESEVGQGNVFTKTKLREAFPEVAQIDRRMRDLRDHGWEILTSRDDPALKMEEQRYAKKGAEVWLPGQAKVSKSKATLSAAQRTEIMQRDDFLCRSCGIGPGEAYDASQPYGPRAKLEIARRTVRLADGSEDVQLMTECDRCRVGGRGGTADLAAVLQEIEVLAPLERDIFTAWAREGHRSPSALEKLWGKYRRLPAESRDVVRQAIAGEEQ